MGSRPGSCYRCTAAASAIQIEPGDRVTIDPTLSDAYAGDWEVTQAPVELLAADSSNGVASPKPGSITLRLQIPQRPA